MADPLILRIAGTPLHLQVRDALKLDTDPAAGLVPALAARVTVAAPAGDPTASIYPNFDTDGPANDRTSCPTPFVVVYNGGKRGHDDIGREAEVVVEVHDDRDHGIERWPGLVARVYRLLAGFTPTSDSINRYRGGLFFKSESPDLPDERYATTVVQIVFAVFTTDRSSARGIQG